MGTITKRNTSSGQTRYLARVRVQGFPPQTQTFRRRTDAKDWVHQTESDLKAGKNTLSKISRVKTISDLIDRYLDDPIEVDRKDFKNKKRLLERWRKEIGKYALANVTPTLISEVRDKLLAEKTIRGGKRSPSTVNRYVFALRSILNLAVGRYHWLDQSPAQHIGRVKEPSGRTRFLSIDEIEKLKNSCKVSKSPHLYLIVLIALGTGARAGEILKLRWSDVDLPNRKLTLYDTKNGENRTLIITDEIVQAFKERKSVVQFSQLVFPDRTGKKPTVFKHAFNEALARAKISDFRFHDLRHSFASHLAMSGATQIELQTLLGHKSASMTKRYAHLSEPHMRDIVEKVNRRMSGE